MYAETKNAHITYDFLSCTLFWSRFVIHSYVVAFLVKYVLLSNRN